MEIGMSADRWELKFVENGIEIRTAEGLLATLAYPAKEVGTKEPSDVKRAAHLMAAAPELFQAVKALVSAAESGNSAELKRAAGHGNAAVAKALNIDLSR